MADPTDVEDFYPPDSLQGQVTERVADVHPTLRATLVEHRQYYGYLLPYVFFGDVTRWAVDRFLADDLPVVRELMATLERLYEAGSEEIRELIALGFVENMPSSNESGAALRSELGPHLAQEFRQVNY